ncbi:MAG: DUF2281 domain-containing protein [Oscillospiraceae bacterium]|nr:DUF2281 domain-containing protein [Oscillospiraceae bacterium]
MYSIKAIYDGINFKPIQPIPVKEEYEVVITFIQPMKKNMVDVDKSVKIPCSELLGLLKGKVWMADDFNAPLEEMREYME